jgi:hypothetical protein
MKYLGDEYAKKTIQFIRASDFSNYLSNETYDTDYDEEEITKKKKEMKMPIYNFSECISKIKKYYNLNESENIFSEIIEYNDVVYKNGKKNPNEILNSTSFRLFLSNGSIINHSICYDKCPYGSIEDNETSSCIEIYKYLINQSLTVDYFLNKISYENRLEYLGDGYAKDTTQIFNSSDFRNYLSNETYDPDYDEEEIIKKKKEMKMPIYNFVECISKIIKHYNLNESEQIFSEIIEYNDEFNKNGKKNPDVILNSTSFRFFLNNGSIIDHSICYGLDIIE